MRLQLRGDGMGDVVGLHAARRLLAKQRDTLAHVAAMVGDDLYRHTCARAHAFQHRRHPNAGTLGRHLHRQHRHVTVTGRIPGLGQPTGRNAEHHQTFLRAQCHRVIDDENPIVAPWQRTLQDGQAQPIAPGQHGGRGGNAQRQVACQQAQHPTDPATTEAGVQIQLQAERDHLQAMMMVGDPGRYHRHGRLVAVVLVGFTTGCAARRCFAPSRQRPRLPVGSAALQVANAYLRRTQALLTLQGLGFPVIARVAKQTRQPRDGSLQIVHARPTSDRVPARLGAAVCSHIQGFSMVQGTSSSLLSVLVAKHLSCMNH